MKRIFVFLIIGLAIASVADAQKGHKHKRHKGIFTTCDFVNDKLRLMMKFNPKDFDRSQTPDGKYKSPKPATLSSTYAAPLAKAFNRASTSMQNLFCKLDYVYVTTDTDPAWQPFGVWEGPGRGDGKKFIVIPSSTLDNISNSLSVEENDLTGRVFSMLFSYFSETNTSDSVTALLAIMAHELGHVVFAASNADGNQPQQNPRNLPKPGPCFDDNFLAAWDVSKFSPRRWVEFGTTNGNAYLDPNITPGTFSQNMMTYLYQKTPLVSLFASVSPEEDFVETFKYYVLATASSPPDLQIPGIQTNLVSRVKPSASPLGQKVTCVQTLLAKM